MAQVQQAGTPILLTASGVVSQTSGSLIGFFVNSTTAGTIVLRDGTTGSATAVTGTITPSAGWNTLPAYFVNGCFASLGGTINVTFVFSAG